MVTGPYWPHSPSCGRKSAAGEIQIGERKQREHLRAILGDAAIANLAIAELALHDTEHVLHFGAYFAEAAIARLLSLGKLAPGFDLLLEALDVARSMPGWTIVASESGARRIEASQQSRWFRFTDDIVIRVACDEVGARIDMRSTSRQGRSDFGVNAARIRAYLVALRQRIG